MGRAIDTAKRIDDLDRRLKLVEDALEEMVQTRTHHVDLTDMHKEEKPKEIVVTKAKKRTKKVAATA